MSAQTAQEQELATILVDVLELDDLEPQDIVPTAPLFDPSSPDSLGLDSIDALEIALAIGKNFQVQLKADDADNRKIFYSLRSLSDYISSQR